MLEIVYVIYIAERFLQPAFRGKSRGCERMLRGFLIFGTLVNISNFKAMIKHPHMPFFFASLLPSTASPGLKFPIMTIQFLIALTSWGNIFMWVCIHFTWAYPGVFIL